MKQGASTEAGTKASRPDEWAQLFDEFARHGLEDVAMRANIMLMNCGPERAKRYFEQQMRLRGI